MRIESHTESHDWLKPPTYHVDKSNAVADGEAVVVGFKTVGVKVGITLSKDVDGTLVGA